MKYHTRPVDGFYICEFCGAVVDRQTVKESRAHYTYRRFIMCESCGDKFIELYNDLRGEEDDI